MYMFLLSKLTKCTIGEGKGFASDRNLAMDVGWVVCGWLN